MMREGASERVRARWQEPKSKKSSLLSQKLTSPPSIVIVITVRCGTNKCALLIILILFSQQVAFYLSIDHGQLEIYCSMQQAGFRTTEQVLEYAA